MIPRHGLGINPPNPSIPHVWAPLQSSNNFWQCFQLILSSHLCSLCWVPARRVLTDVTNDAMMRPLLSSSALVYLNLPLAQAEFD